MAISTACGALDNIIVDTMDTAVQCVDFLRKQDVGVATFIGLDKMERWRREAHGKITTYGTKSPNLLIFILTIIDSILHLVADICCKNDLLFFCFFSPEGVPRLFDLVKAKEEKFLTAFYFALRDTLVAKDLDQATRIALQVKLCYMNVILSSILFYDYCRGVLVTVL